MYNKTKKFNIILEKILVLLILIYDKKLIILCLSKLYLHYILRYVDSYK